MERPPVESVKLDKNILQLQLVMNSGLEAFEGHFDSIAVVPGVVQIAWVIDFFTEYFQKHNKRAVEIKGLEALKFHQVILSEYKVTLNIEIKDKNIIFNYSSSHGKHSSGKIILS